jgi:predicted DNA-binding transcriptional regulator AlpA
MNFATIKEISETYKISKSSLYRLSKDDPTFPAFNIGLKKKIVINHTEFKVWIKSRNIKEEIFKLPTGTIYIRRKNYEAKKDFY